MKRCSFGLAVLAILVFALTLPVTAPAAPAPRHAQPVAAAANAKPAAAAAQRHPEIRAAMEALRQAQNNLDRAEHHFGGHRTAAMKHINQAMHELDLCMKYR